MLLLRIINFIKGYISLQLEGNFPEKFINISAKRGMFFWDIKRDYEKETEPDKARTKRKKIKLKINIKDFKKLRPIARKSKCKVKILKKSGIPFLLFRYRKRKVFLIGAIFFIVLFYIMTSFVWAIEIIGDETIDKSVLINKLEENGVRSGSLKYAINYDDLSKKILLEMKEFSWISIYMKGTKLKVEVQKSIEKPNIIAKNEPCNLVSSHDGIIVSIDIKYGEQRVSVGDTITKGQTLISGEIISKNPSEPPRFVHAVGLIKARTWYEEEINVDIYDENVIKYEEPDIEKAKEEAYQKALSDLYSKLSAKTVVMSNNCEFKQINDRQMKVSVIIECIEDIGSEQKI